MGVIESLDGIAFFTHLFSVLGESVGKMLAPSLSEQEFQANLQKI
jgi:hypothetical protein